MTTNDKKSYTYEEVYNLFYRLGYTPNDIKKIIQGKFNNRVEDQNQNTNQTKKK